MSEARSWNVKLVRPDLFNALISAGLEAQDGVEPMEALGDACYAYGVDLNRALAAITRVLRRDRYTTYHYRHNLNARQYLTGMPDAARLLSRAGYCLSTGTRPEDPV